jgi:hypothetical protein
MFILDKTASEAYLIDVAIPNSHNLQQHHHRESPGGNRLERRTNNNMVTENGLYNIISTIHYPRVLSARRVLGLAV